MASFLQASRMRYDGYRRAAKEFTRLKEEIVNQTVDGIRTRQEEDSECIRELSEARKDYREQLEAIETQWLRNQARRNENNFADAV